MKYSTVKALINEDYSRETIRTLDAYLINDDANWILNACVLVDTDDRSIREYFAEIADGLLADSGSEIINLYFDYDAFGRDLLLGGDYSKLEHKGHMILIDNH